VAENFSTRPLNLQAQARRIALCCVVLAMLLAGCALAGWWFDLPR